MEVSKTCVLLIHVLLLVESNNVDAVSIGFVDFDFGNPWTECSSFCGGGLQTMTKWNYIASTNGGSEEANRRPPIRTCNEKRCPGNMF